MEKFKKGLSKGITTPFNTSCIVKLRRIRYIIINE